MCVPVDTHIGTHTRVPPSPPLPCSKPPVASQVGGGLTKEGGGMKGTSQQTKMLPCLATWAGHLASRSLPADQLRTHLAGLR